MRAVAVKAGDEVCLQGLPEVCGGQDVETVHRGLAAVLVNVPSVVSSVSGEDLAVLQVRKAWPELPPGLERR